jgi:hypothetical protein
MEEILGCAVVTPGENKKIRLPRPFSIFNAEAEAINTAISITRNTIQSMILSDSLSCITALDGIWKIYNPKVVRMLSNPPKEEVPDSREIKRHCKGKPTRTTKPLQKTGKTG